MCGLCYKRSWTGDGRHESTSRTGYLAMPTMLDSRRARCMGKCAPTRRDQLRKNCCPSKATSKTVHTSARVGMWRVPLHVRDRESFLVAASASARRSLQLHYFNCNLLLLLWSMQGFLQLRIGSRFASCSWPFCWRPA